MGGVLRDASFGIAFIDWSSVAEGHQTASQKDCKGEKEAIHSSDMLIEFREPNSEKIYNILVGGV